MRACCAQPRPHLTHPTPFIPNPTLPIPALYPPGTIDAKELRDALGSLGFEAKNAAVFSLVEAGDSNGDRRLDFDEFLDMMTAKLVSWARGGGGYRMGWGVGVGVG